MVNKVKKAGCILIDKNNKKIALVYREKYNDYSFPKGHLEEGETLIECAIRETAEETKRNCKILEKEPIYIEEYITPRGENCIMYYYISEDIGQSDYSSEDTHDTIWVSLEEIRDKLTYDSLRAVWDCIKDKVIYYMEK
jgi:8-oxo-dGTP diphosphatase